ncbi:zinc finger HIT domain-containing protein 2 [Engystomops pustulosus]|uniref:zinc finger HIT domain-containing protein 2 n=1 Tax=Engystomops pustulosus TaxID=76066 RepID=UPI003AFA5600
MEPDIVLPGRGSSPTPADDGGRSPAVCALCLSAPGKYTCPRCNAPYCSLACYRGGRHSACSELFYRESVLRALSEEEAGSGGRRQMEDVLLRLREEEAGGGGRRHMEDTAGDEESGLWSSLSRQEREHFQSLLQSGHIGVLVPRWRPWWDTHQGSKITVLPDLCPESPLPPGDSQQTCDRSATRSTQEKHNHNVSTNHQQDIISPEEVQKMELKEEVSAKHGSHKTKDDRRQDDKVSQVIEGDASSVSEIPSILPSIPPLSTLTHSPSPLVRYILVNVIYSYSFSLLRHNGDLGDSEMMLEFIGTLLSVSGALSTTSVYNSTAHAIKSAVRAASDPLLGGDEGAAVLAMEATAKILLGDGGKSYSLAALSHLHRVLGKIRKLVTEEKDLRKTAYNAKKKCLFLAAWVNENGEVLPVLSAEVTMEYKQHLKDLNEMSQLTKGLENVWGGKRPPPKKQLIEEVN